ncbi:MAG: response regulator [Deltaproteobacteria bacterium]|nr:response regulator [Deltaproteobacteria bacterium]
MHTPLINQLLAASDVASCCVSTTTGQITHCNARFVRLFGDGKADSVIGRELVALLEERGWSADDAIGPTADDAPAREIRLRHKDGSRWKVSDAPLAGCADSRLVTVVHNESAAHRVSNDDLHKQSALLSGVVELFSDGDIAQAVEQTLHILRDFLDLPAETACWACLHEDGERRFVTSGSPDTGHLSACAGGRCKDCVVRSLSSQDEPQKATPYVRRGADQTPWLLIIPLVTENQVVGVLHFSLERALTIEPALTQFLQAVGRSVALALDRAQANALLRRMNVTLEDRVARRTRELESLAVLSQELGTARSTEELIRTAFAHLGPAVKHDVVAALVVTDDRARLFLQSNRPLSRLARDVAIADVLKRYARIYGPLPAEDLSLRQFSGNDELITDADAPPTRRKIETLQSAISGPFLRATRTAPRGLLWISRERRKPYSESRTRFLHTIANQLGMAIQRMTTARDAEQQRLSRLVQRLPAGIVVCDAQGNVLLTNPLWEKHQRIIAPNSQQRLTEIAGHTLQELLESSSEEPIEVHFGTRPQRTFALRALSTEHGRELAVTSLEITDERVRERQAARQERLALVGRLAGGIAHDFNNLLSVILNFAQFLIDDLGEDDPRCDDAKAIHQAAERAVDLTGQLLAFSRRELVNPEVLDVNHTVGDLEKLLRRLIGDDVDLKTELCPEPWPVKIDRSKLEQVLANLAVNARDAMPDGGKLVIVTQNVTLSDNQVGDDYYTVPRGRYLQLSVYDTGVGIEPSELQHIFEPFYTTKDQGKGTGLGLATVYGVVKQAGGYIDVNSQINVGTRFDIYMPTPKGATVSHRELRPRRDTPTGAERILVVEDEPAVRISTARILRDAGYFVQEAGGGGEALALIERGEHFDLLLTDVVMPDISGIKLAQSVLEKSTSTRVLYMSGYTNAHLGDQAIAPPSQFLQKPIVAHELTNRVRELLDLKPVKHQASARRLTNA